MSDVDHLPTITEYTIEGPAGRLSKRGLAHHDVQAIAWAALGAVTTARWARLELRQRRAGVFEIEGHNGPDDRSGVYLLTLGENSDHSAIPGASRGRARLPPSPNQGGDHDPAIGASDLEPLADRIAKEAMIPVCEVGLDDWTVTMDEPSDASRVTSSIPFRGEEQIARLAVDWRSGGHAIAVSPDSIGYSMWSRDKDAATIRAEADTVMASIAQRWREAMNQLKAYNTRAHDEVMGTLEDRRRVIGERLTLRDVLNRHLPHGAGHEASRHTTQP